MEEKTLDSSIILAHTDNIVLGCRYFNERIINPFRGHLGDVRLYDMGYHERNSKYYRYQIGCPNSDLKYLKQCNFTPKGATISKCRSLCEKQRNCDELLLPDM